MMKKCSKCLIEKEYHEFNKSKSSKDGLYYCCKFCRKLDMQIRWKNKSQEEKNIKYKKNYEISIIDPFRKQKKNNYSKKARLVKKEKINLIKSATPCIDCNKFYPPECLDFDHLDPIKKINNVSTLVNSTNSLDIVLSEIRKCELICSNCHRIRTFNSLKNKKIDYIFQKNINTSNPKYKIIKNREAGIKFYLEVKPIIDDLKSNPCVDCKGIFPVIAMDFDHLNNKYMNISTMIHRERSLFKILDEIKKCELVCSNCYRVRTYVRQSNKTKERNLNG